MRSSGTHDARVLDGFLARLLTASAKPARQNTLAYSRLTRARTPASPFRGQRRVDRARRLFAVLDRRDGQILPAIDAVAAGPDAFQAGAALFVDEDAPILALQGAAISGGNQGLANGGEDDVGLKPERLAGPDQPAPLLSRRLEYDRTNRALPFEGDGLGPGADQDAVGLGKLLLVAARLHLLLAASIDDRHQFGAEPLALHRDVDRRHAAADHDDAAADRQFRQVFRLAQLGDVLDGVDDIGERRLIGEAELIDAGQAETEKDGVVIALQALQIDVAAERHAVLHRNAADREDEGGLSLGEIARRLVGGDAVFVEPGRLFPRFENRHVM